MTQKTRIKICIVMVIIWLMWFSDWSFAEDTDKQIEFLWIGINIVLSVLGWIWVFFANIAWTFLTNKWVYWEVFWWDVLLWKFWNIVKNFANFWLWFYFMYVIFKWLIKQVKWEDITKNLKDTILWLLIAWIWIQSSRFLTATVIDVSSITLAAAWAFPSQILSESEYTEKAMRNSISNLLNDEKWKKITLFPKDAKGSSFLKTSTFEVDTSALGLDSNWERANSNKLIEYLMPNKEDVAWPLYFIWFSFLKTNEETSINTSSIDEIIWDILNMFIQSWTTIVFSIEMLMLCIIALMRIVYLWMFIVLSPLVVLLKCLEKMWDKDLLNANAVKSLWKQISIKTFLANTFKPTLVVLWLWIAVIFVTLMKGVILEYDGATIDIGWEKITSIDQPTSNINSTEWDKKYTSIIDGDLLKFVALNIGKTLLEVILSIIVVIMIYFIVRLAMKMWWWDDFISKKIWWITDTFENLVMKTPIIPVVWYDNQWVPKPSSISIWGLASLPKDYMNKNVKQKVETYSANQEDAIMKKLWFEDKNILTETHKTDIRHILSQQKDWYDILWEANEYIGKIKTPEWRWMKLNPNTSDKFWIQQFTDWLNKRVEEGDYINFKPEWMKMIEDWKSLNQKEPTKRTLEDLFDKPDHANTYAKYFGYKSWNYQRFKDIQELDISQK